MAKVIMVQGTMSNVGKSVVAAALCRIFKQDGYKVCPFKSQNMALNSYITKEGLEMGRAQVMQAEAAGIEPTAKMNPILLKPNSDSGSQIIVCGEVWGNMSARDYYASKSQFREKVIEAYEELDREYDIIVIEGAGSPAEINLKGENGFVNMGMAKIADAPVLLVGDIDRGGVFAQLYGTVKLLEKEEQTRIQGLIINKFRGDPSLLTSGLSTIEELTGVQVIGTLPYLHLDLDDEDSLSERLDNTDEVDLIDIVVIRVPRLSNFTDFAVYEQMEHVSLRYVDSVDKLKEPDMIILPGTKSTMADLLWMRQNGLEAVIQKKAAQGTIVFGVCGGYQMLGTELSDPEGIESGGRIKGMDLLPVTTIFEREKHRTQLSGQFGEVGGPLQGLSHVEFEGYEIHHGKAEYREGVEPMSQLSNGKHDGAQCNNVYGSYIHGIFDATGVAETIIHTLLTRKGYDPSTVMTVNRAEYKEQQYDLLAASVRENLDMEQLYRILDWKENGI